MPVWIVSYSVRYAIDLAGLPTDVRRQIEHAFAEVAEAVATIPESSAFFSSMDDSVLQIDVAGWRLGYCIDPGLHELRVVESTPPSARR